MEINNTNTDLSSIMEKMLVQLTCQEFCSLLKFAAGGNTTSPSSSPIIKTHQVVGVTPLASELGCSASFLYTLKSKGVLDGATISRIGKKTVFDVDKARALADHYQAEQRAMKK